MIYIINNIYGNPSSLHSLGYQAELELKAARKAVAELLCVQPDELIFASGGTEANNLAVFGGARAKKRLGNKIVTTAAEHSSVYESCKALEDEGFTVEYISPDENGMITEQQLEQAIDKNTVLVSVMMVNNETGAIFPVESIRRIIKQKSSPALFHCDAVQAFGKIPVKPKKLDADLLTVSSHKIHGPKGTGALYIKKGTHIKPLFYGGEQERKIRPGTEALPLICGFGAAAEAVGNISANLQRVRELRDYTAEKLMSIDGIELNSPESSLPYILNISAVGVRSETMLHFLEGKNIFVSSGSACSKGKKSRVLTAMELSPQRIDSAVRISFSKNSTKEESDALALAISEGMKSLARAKRSG